MLKRGRTPIMRLSCMCLPVCAQGLRGLYAGFLTTLVRDVPESCISFGLYQCLRDWLGGEGHPVSVVTHSVSNMTTGRSLG